MQVTLLHNHLPHGGGKVKPFTMAFKALKDLSPASLTTEVGLSSLSHSSLALGDVWDLRAWTMLPSLLVSVALNSPPESLLNLFPVGSSLHSHTSLPGSHC